MGTNLPRRGDITSAYIKIVYILPMGTVWGLRQPERGDVGETANHLVALVIESWRDLDVVGGTAMAVHFTPDGVFDLGTARFVGREAIEASLAARTAHGPRTTRHVTSNFRCALDNDDRGSVEYIICTYGADGDAVVPLDGPTAVGDMRDVFAREDDGRWLIESRVFTPVLVAEERFAPSLKAADGAGRSWR
jgi:hypothetical protein